MKRAAILMSVLAAAAIVIGAGGGKKSLLVTGGGETVLTGGNGESDLMLLAPVKTRFAFRAFKPAGGVAEGFFECLALAPGAVGGAGSGNFDQNIMYVTGVVTGLEQIDKRTAQMTGVVRCTNLGAGEDINFQATVTDGGPGARLFLTVDSLPSFPFEEIVTEGSIHIEKVN